MAEGINRYFMADTRAFVDANYLTTAGIFHPPEGTMAFDLHRQEGITPSVVTIEPTNTAKNDESIRGYWVPQGGSCDVPIIAADRAYVFTPDFSGCSLIVDQINLIISINNASKALGTNYNFTGNEYQTSALYNSGGPQSQ